MKRRWLVSAVLLLSLSMWLAGTASGTGAATVDDYARATDLDTTGISMHCDTAACPIPLVVPWTFKIDSVGSPYDAVLTASFTYKTSKGLTVTATPQLSNGTTHVPIPSSARPLPPAASSKSATLTWLVPNLDATTEYGLYISLLPSKGESPPFDLSTGNVTLVVEGAPS